MSLKKIIQPPVIDPWVYSFLKESNAIEEVFDNQSLNDAVKAWDFINGKTILTMGYLLKTHAILMMNQPLEKKYQGKIRDINVQVGGRIKLPFSAIVEYLKRLIILMNRDDASESDIKRYHVMFEEIHPFVDGNGRTGRILYNWQRIKCGYGIHVLDAAHRGSYYKWFNDATLYNVYGESELQKVKK